MVASRYNRLGPRLRIPLRHQRSLFAKFRRTGRGGIPSTRLCTDSYEFALGVIGIISLDEPVVSAGASGVVFGIWGALVVFGFRFRRLLPPRYRRYFVYSVTPYALFALYIGFIMSNVDHFAHIGGVIGGSLAAATMKPRLLCKPESLYRAGVLLAIPILIIGIASIYRGPHLELRELPVTGRFGFKFNAPSAWEQTISKSQANIETRSFQIWPALPSELKCEEEPHSNHSVMVPWISSTLRLRPKLKTSVQRVFDSLIGPPVNWEVSMHYA